MKVIHVERWTIEIIEEPGDTPRTTADSLIKALDCLPKGASISVATQPSFLQATYVHPDIEIR